MGRLIDAHKLKEVLSKSTCHWTEEMWKRVTMDIIDNQPTAESNQWIPFDGTYPKITEGTFRRGYVTLIGGEDRRFVIKMGYSNTDGFVHLNGRKINESMIAAYTFEEYPEPYKEQEEIKNV